MKQTAIYILTIGLLGLSSCHSDSVSMRDFYYPLEEIDDYMVYEYDRTDRYEDQIDSTKLYYKVMRLNDEKFAVVSLNEHLLSGDSLLLRLEDGALIMEEYYQWITSGFIKSETPSQIYYPSQLGLNESHTYNLEFDAADSERYHTEKITETINLVDIEPTKVTLHNQMVFEQIGINTNDNSSNSTEYEIEFEKSKGMFSFETTTGTYETKFKLNRIWKSDEWKK